MSKHPPKKLAELSHRLAALLYLTAETLQEIEPTTQIANDVISDCKNLQPKIESVLDDLFQVKQVAASNYLIDLANKVDTVVRKNFQQIQQ